MNSYWALYLIESADSIGLVFFILTILSAVAMVIMAIVTAMYTEENETLKDYYAKLLMKSMYMFAICLLIFAFIPRTSSLYKIIGIGSVLEYVNNNEEAKQLPDNAIKAINYYLEQIPKENVNKDREQACENRQD
jgi:hypothetical protein